MTIDVYEGVHEHRRMEAEWVPNRNAFTPLSRQILGDCVMQPLISHAPLDRGRFWMLFRTFENAIIRYF